MANASTLLIAEGAAVAAKSAMHLSHAPEVQAFPDHVEIILDADLQDQVAAFIIRQIESDPGDIRIIGMGGVWVKVLIKKYGLWVAGALAGAFGFGFITKAAK
jgi:hypothetical protein